MNRWKRVAIVAATVIALLLAFIVLILPSIIRTQAVQWVATHTDRTLTIDQIHINPFTLSVELRGFVLSEAGDPTPFITFDLLYLSFSTRSLLVRGPITKTLRLERPVVRLVRSSANTYNFSDLLELGNADTAKPETKEEQSLNFSFNNITVNRGALDFIDQMVTPIAQHRVRDLQLAIPFIGNVAYLADEYVTPLLSATVNDAPLTFGGKLKPFADTVEATVEIKVDNLDLPEYATYLPAELPVKIRTGHLSSALGIGYRVTRDAGPQISLTGDITLTGLTVDDHNGAPLCFLPLGKLTIAGAEPLSDKIILNEIIIYGLELTINRDHESTWNFERLTAGTDSPNAAVESETQSAGEGPQLAVGSIRLRGGRLHFRDELPVGGFATVLKEISIDLQNIDTGTNQSSPLRVALESELGEKASMSGSIVLQPFAAAVKIEMTGIPLEPYFPYLANVLTRSPVGSLSAGAEAELSPEGTIRLKNGSVTIRDLFLPFGGIDGLGLARFALGGITVDSGERRAEVSTVEAENGNLRFSCDAAGVLSPLSLLHPSSADPKSSTSAEPPFRWTIARAAATRLSVTFVDGILPERPAYAFRNAAIVLDGLHSSGPEFEKLTASAAYGRRGQLNLSASGLAAPLDIAGKLRLRRIPLSDINHYLPADINVELVSADLDASLDFQLDEVSSGLDGEFAGDIGVRGFHATEKVSGDDLLLWESLQLGRIRFTLAPFSLHIREVALNDFQSRVIINPDGSINLQRVFGDVTDKPPSAPSEPPAETDRRPEIAIDSITLQKGILDFTDRHMRPAFRVKMLNLGGQIGNMSSKSGKPAEVDLRGNLRNESPLSISGTIDPLAENLFLDLKIRFSDIELSPASPYAGRYLGYLVEKGKLFLDLEYHIENHNLKSRNRIFLDQLTFGEQVESEDATSLPVRLAAALLKDRRGEIHLDLPVTGRTDDPQFSIWGLVWQVLKNLLVKAATSPISLLTAMFGGGEEFSAVSFPYGSTILAETEKVKLKQLAAAFNDRPALKLEVMGYVDRDRDPEAYRNELLGQKMRREKYLEQVKRKEAPPGATVESTTVSPEEVSKYLEAVYKKADFPKPRNFLGLVKSIPEAEMRKLILANTPAGEEELQALAWGRGAAVRAFLVESGRVAPERIFQKRVDIFKEAEEKEVGGNRVEFGIAAP